MGDVDALLVIDEDAVRAGEELGVAAKRGELAIGMNRGRGREV